MLNKLRLLVINVRRRTVLFIVCKYFLFLYIKVALTVRERWPKIKQSEDQLLASSTVYAKCNYHTLLLYQTHLITSPTPPTHVCLLKGNLLTESYFNSCNTFWIFFYLPLVSGMASLSLTQVDFPCPLRTDKMVSNEIHINMC